jgi:hypothetical protein
MSAEAGRSPEEAAAALRAMEPRATPTLLRWLQTRESRLRRRLCELAARQNWFTLEPDRAWERREWAMSGFALLGTNAAPAIPRLARLVDDPEIGPAALGALRGIGLPSAPVLLAALTSQHAEARNGAVQILAKEPFIDLRPDGQHENCCVPAAARVGNFQPRHRGEPRRTASPRSCARQGSGLSE